MIRPAVMVSTTFSILKCLSSGCSLLIQCTLLIAIATVKPIIARIRTQAVMRLSDFSICCSFIINYAGTNPTCLKTEVFTVFPSTSFSTLSLFENEKRGSTPRDFKTSANGPMKNGAPPIRAVLTPRSLQ